MLTIKKLGLQIRGAAYAAGDMTAATPAGQGVVMPAGLSISKSCTDPGDLSGWCVTLSATCPCDECEYPYGVTFRSMLKEPGVNNNEYEPKYQWYGGKIARISCTAGLIDDEFLLEMEDDILTQVTADTAGWVDGYRTYLCTVDTTNAAASIDILDENGTSTTVVAGAATSLALVNAINADATVNLYVEAYIHTPSATSEYFFIRSLVPGYLFTVAANVVTTVEARSMCFQSKSADRKIIPQVDDGFATMAKYTLFKLENTTTAGTTTVAVNVSGVGTVLGAANDHTTAATYAVNINALSTLDTTGVMTAYGNPTGDYVLIWGGSTIDRLLLTFSDATVVASTTTIAWAIGGEGHFPYLTSDDVFKIFANKQHQGKLSMLVYAEQPIDGAEYCHYHLKSVKVYEPDLHGANHLNMYTQDVDLYIRKATITTHIYDKDDALLERSFNRDTAPAAPNTSVEDMLQIWCNCQLANW